MTAVSDRLAAALATALALACFTSTAAAQAPTPADAAFKRGRELLKAGKYADACIEFEHSNKLDPQLGTAFNIAQCSEQVGKLARALELYRELLARDTNADRKAVVAKAIPELEARVPKLVVTAATVPPGLIVALQPVGSVVPPRPIAVNTPIEMDLGEYTIRARGGGIADWKATARIDTEGKTTTVELPVPAAKPVVPVGPVATTPAGDDDDDDGDGEDRAPAAAGSKRKLIAYGVLGVGGAALIGGAVFGSMANSTWSDAKDVCGGTTCATRADVDRANALADDARGKATLSTVFFVAGAAAAATGIVLWVTAPSDEREVQVSGAPTSGGGAVTLSGRF